MSRAAFVFRSFRCMRCCGAYEFSTRHFRLGFWTSNVFRGKPLHPTYRDLVCPDPACGAPSTWFESWPRVCSSFILPMREDLRPVVFRRVDERGREHYRYPSHADAAMRPSESRIDFPTLRSMETFLKEQNPNHRDWQVPLNDILDYDEAHIDSSISESDPGAAEDAAAADDAGDDFGTLTESEVSALYPSVKMNIAP